MGVPELPDRKGYRGGAERSSEVGVQAFLRVLYMSQSGSITGRV